MVAFLGKLHSMGVPLAVVGGSDLNKIIEQLADSQQHCEWGKSEPRPEPNPRPRPKPTP